MKPATTSTPSLADAIRAMLTRIDNMTTEEFGRGGEKVEREALRAALPRAEAADALAEAAEKCAAEGIGDTRRALLAGELRAALRRYREGGAK